MSHKTRRPAIAVLDIGKSNVKLALVDGGDAGGHGGADGSQHRPAEEPLPSFRRRGAVGVDRRGTGRACRRRPRSRRSRRRRMPVPSRSLPVINWRCRSPTTRIRVPSAIGRPTIATAATFAELLSPNLPNGLNGGRQIYWQKRAFPDAYARVDAILPYPEYWVWRLTRREGRRGDLARLPQRPVEPARRHLLANGGAGGHCRPLPADREGVGHGRAR